MNNHFYPLTRIQDDTDEVMGNDNAEDVLKAMRLEREVPKCFRCRQRRCVHSGTTYTRHLPKVDNLCDVEMTDAEEEMEVDAMLQVASEFEAGVQRSAWFWSIFTLTRA